jgi:DNA-binding SARP family transcriptional activator
VLTVAVLGRVEVRRDGVPAPVPSGLTTELLVRLALDAGRPVRAERLVEELWPGTTGTRLNTLQAKVSQLRRALGDPAALIGASGGYTLAVDPGRVDAVRALRLAEEGAALLAAGDPAASAVTCREGLALFGAEVLPAAGGSDWVLPHRVRLEETRLRLLEDELAARLALGATGELVGELESLVAVHPLRERLWALLITALYRAGRCSYGRQAVEARSWKSASRAVWTSRTT